MVLLIVDHDQEDIRPPGRLIGRDGRQREGQTEQDGSEGGDKSREDGLRVRGRVL